MVTSVYREVGSSIKVLVASRDCRRIACFVFWGRRNESIELRDEKGQENAGK